MFTVFLSVINLANVTNYSSIFEAGHPSPLGEGMRERADLQKKILHFSNYFS
jgi:hypothetical protein